MKRSGPSSLLVSVVRWSATHPRTVLLSALAIVLLSVLATARMRISGSLSDMLGSDSPESQALTRLVSEYRSAEELLVIVTLAKPELDSPRVLTDHADRLIHAITSDPDSSALITGASYVRSREYADFIRQIAAPSIAYYLDDPAFDELLNRLTPQGMQTQLRRAESLLAAPGPAASGVAKSVLRDPLRIAELVSIPGLDSDVLLADDQTATSPEFSIDQSSLLIRVTGAQGVNDLAFSKRLTSYVQSAIDRTPSENVVVDLAGGYAIADTTSRGIRRDSVVSVLVALILLTLLFAACYRRVLAPFLIGVVAAVGILAGFGAYALHSPTITPLTAVIAALLAGLGIDYGIHFLSHYQVHRTTGASSVDAAITAISDVGTPIVTNCLTSMIGFGSLYWSSLQMLRDFAVLGALGLLGCLISVVFLMPAILVTLDRPTSATRRPPRFGHLATFGYRRPRIALGLASVAIMIALAGVASNGTVIRQEADLAVMHPRPNRPLDLTDSLSHSFSDMGEVLPIEIQADSPSRMLALAHQVAADVSAQSTSIHGFRRVVGIPTVLPHPDRAISRRLALQQLDPEQVAQAFVSALEASQLNSDSFEGYVGYLWSIVTAAPPGMNSLTAFPTIASQWLPRDSLSSIDGATSTVLAVQMTGPFADRVARDSTITAIRRILTDTPEATLTGVSVATYELERATRSDLPRSIGISLLLVLAWLAAVLRNPVDVLLAVAPLAFAIVITLGVLLWTRIPINAVNGVAIPLLDGIAIDAGVFLVVSARNARRTGADLNVKLLSTAQAVFAASATTVAGFVALCATSTPAIRSLGMLGSIGILASLGGAMLILIPVLSLLNHRRGRVLA